ncbi:MAG: hypothetical protein FRX49_07520 [Trebouxia sp. A1-2]|nr:MAG: hypothetical protein FRX49_07520 [Trebouxia sp. A1-2]
MHRHCISILQSKRLMLRPSPAPAWSPFSTAGDASAEACSDEAGPGCPAFASGDLPESSEGNNMRKKGDGRR